MCIRDRLDTSFLEQEHGLAQMVTDPTHCGHLIIDKVFVSRPDLYNCSVIQSTLKTKHKAIVLGQELYDLREPNIDRLRYNFGTYPWASLILSTDVEQVYCDFVNIVHNILDLSVPVKMVSIGLKDPEYVTPLVKSLLRKRNRMRRRGHFERAEALAHRINALITEKRSNALDKLVDCNAKELWKAVNKTKNKKVTNCSNDILRDPETVNEYFAEVSSKENYDIHYYYYY